MDSICRLCGHFSSQLESVFSFVEGGRLLSDLIYIVCPIRIEVNDNLPKKICEECQEIVVSSIRLRESSVKSDLKFRLQSPIKRASRDFEQEQMEPPLEVKQEQDDEQLAMMEEEFNREDESIQQSEDDDSDDMDDSMKGQRKKYREAKGRFGCPFECGADFAHKSNARRHVRTEHEADDPPLTKVRCFTSTISTHDESEHLTNEAFSTKGRQRLKKYYRVKRCDYLNRGNGKVTKKYMCICLICDKQARENLTDPSLHVEKLISQPVDWTSNLMKHLTVHSIVLENLRPNRRDKLETTKS